VHDGTGAPAYRADIGIRGDSIAFVGDSRARKVKSFRTIDAGGYVVAPGFIDPHTHLEYDLSRRDRREVLSQVFQGVTTAVIGNDGGGMIGAAVFLAEIDSAGAGVNVATFIGHNRIRRAVMGMADRPPTADELEQMKSLVARGMEEGALGLSAGLFYTPGNFAETEEVIELARVAAAYGGIYDVHIRDESSYNIGLVAAVEETIRIAGAAGIHANISHIKALGADVWGKSREVVRLIEAARARGVSVSADQYPYEASSTGLHAALLPRWVFSDDPDYRSKLNDESLLSDIKAGMADNLRRRGGPAAILLSAPGKMDSIRGKTLDRVARDWSLDPLEAALHVLRNGGASIVSFNMTEADIHHFMQQPWVMTSSDASAGHPRKYGTFPRKIRHYVLEKGVLTLEEMIHRSTWLTARTFGIPNRGRLAPGYHADLIVFRPEEVVDMATFEAPAEYARGMQYVLINGQVVVDRGAFTGTRAGRAVRRRTALP
jgi:N-acyl-D-aspartate/D-glutamate deacylase